MPVTKTAKRALRSSKRKTIINKRIIAQLEIAIRKAEKTKTGKAVREAISLADKSAKTNVIHRNKAARIKSRLSSLEKKSSKIKSKSKK